MRTFTGLLPTSCVSLLLILFLVIALGAQESVTRRARPPQWDRVPPGLFFQDAFAEGLRGERPATLGGQAELPPTSANSPPVIDSDGSRSTKWSESISPATLEDEIKAIQRRMTEAVAHEGDFRAQGYRELRPHLATAAVLFAVIDQYDGRVRWQLDAATARDRFARAAQNLRTPVPQVVRQVVELEQGVGDLIRGARLAGPAGAQSTAWSDVADRQLIMQRLEISSETLLGPAVASSTTVRQRQAELMHESELTALLASVLKQSDMPDATDDEYHALCEQLERAALRLRQAAQSDNAPAARQAFGDIKTRCATCHERYRE